MPEAARPGTGADTRGPLNEVLKRIGRKGPITFAEFMDVALYWPDGGYYTSGRETWGGGGDYITSLDVSPLFSRTLARQVHEMWTSLGSPDSFELVEPGAGRGWLSKGILAALKGMGPGLGDIIRVRFVEKNPHMREAPGEQTNWHERLDEITPFTGCILSNELIDSFPVHRVICGTEGLQEVYVGAEDGHLVDVAGPPSTPELHEYFKRLGIEFTGGQVGEVNLAALGWIEAAGSLLQRGFVMTIDYGLPARELYSTERPGTLLCHYRHTLSADPYANVGEQDITTHVDFTSFAEAGLGSGLGLTGFTTQKNFFLGLGVLDDLAELTGSGVAEAERVRLTQGVKELIMPGGMGGTFKVIVQHKGVEAPVLAGFSFKDMSAHLGVRA